MPLPPDASKEEEEEEACAGSHPLILLTVAVQPQLIDRRCGAEAQMLQRLRALTLLLMPSPKWRWFLRKHWWNGRGSSRVVCIQEWKRCFAGPWPDDLRPCPFCQMHPKRRTQCAFVRCSVWKLLITAAGNIWSQPTFWTCGSCRTCARSHDDGFSAAL